MGYLNTAYELGAAHARTAFEKHSMSAAAAAFMNAPPGQGTTAFKAHEAKRTGVTATPQQTNALRTGMSAPSPAPAPAPAAVGSAGPVGAMGGTK